MSVAFVTWSKCLYGICAVSGHWLGSPPSDIVVRVRDATDFCERRIIFPRILTDWLSSGDVTEEIDRVLSRVSSVS